MRHPVKLNATSHACAHAVRSKARPCAQLRPVAVHDPCRSARRYDNCNAPSTDDVRERYRAMGAALNATGRHIHFAMCSWGVGDPWLGWGSEV